MKVIRRLYCLIVLFIFIIAPPVLFGEVSADITGPTGQPDGVVNQFELTALANQWLAETPKALPAYNIVQLNNMSEGQAEDFSNKLLGFNPDSPIINPDGNYPALYVDPEKLLSLPTIPLTNTHLGEMYEQGDGEAPPTLMSFDFGAINNIVPYNHEIAIDRLSNALHTANLYPENGKPVVYHSMFEAVDVSGNTIVENIMLDTQVSFDMQLNGIPLIGPGAQISTSFSPSGDVTNIFYAMPEITPIVDQESSATNPLMFDLISPTEAKRKCAQLYPGLGVQTTPRLIYYAHSVERGYSILTPCYECSGEAEDENGLAVPVLMKIIPAVTDILLKPTIDLFEASVDAQGDVTAFAIVSGGSGAYLHQWSSSSTSLIPAIPTSGSITYSPNHRPTGQSTQVPYVEEKVMVTVTCLSTGNQAYASKTIVVPRSNFSMDSVPQSASLVGGVHDYGVERAVSDMGSDIQNGYNAVMAEEGVFRRFNWSGTSAWENDFKSPNDSTYVDNVDQVLYIGHGNGTGFTFESNHDDTKIHYTDPVGDWGDKDLEWLCLVSCQVLKDTSDGKKWYARWGPCFDGLHLLCGFQTNAYDRSNYGRAFAQYQTGRYVPFYNFPAFSIRQSWFLAKKYEQPSSAQSVVMGVLGPDNCLGGWGDYLHGNGPVGPDLRGDDIKGYWRIVYQ
jgi:hypothetical protein